MAPQSGGGRPASYRLTDGTRVPGCTTITGRYKDGSGLLHWAWQQGIDGKDYRATRDNAGTAGTFAHELIDADIHAREPELGSAKSNGMDETTYAEAVRRAMVAFGAYQDWRKAVALDVLWTEVPLISERHRYGGTLDAIARIGGKLALFDWKSSSRIYSDYIVQVSAYRQLWEETHPDDKIEALHLVRVDKEFGGFAHHSWPIAVLDAGWEAFWLMRKLYDLDATLKRAAA